MKTFFREMIWNDDTDQGSYSAVVIAPDDATAERIVALAMLDNEDAPHDAAAAAEMLCDLSAGSLHAYYEQHAEMQCWDGLNGTACPNCTSHCGKPTGNHFEMDGATREIHECDECGFTWAPLGFGEKRKELETLAIETIARADEIDAAVKELSA